MQKILFSMLAVLVLCTGWARADSIATISVNASFIDDPNQFNQPTPPGPSFSMTGNFTLDEETQQISSWNLTFNSSTGSTYTLSPQNGGMSTAFCMGGAGMPCPLPAPIPMTTIPGWYFAFSDASASVTMDSIYGTTLPFYDGEVIQLCPLQNTDYYGGTSVLSYACAFTSHATFDGQTGYMYGLLPAGYSSGTLTVTSLVSTPEPTAFFLLLVGGGSLSITGALRKRKTI